MEVVALFGPFWARFFKMVDDLEEGEALLSC